MKGCCDFRENLIKVRASKQPKRGHCTVQHHSSANQELFTLFSQKKHNKMDSYHLRDASNHIDSAF